MPFDVFDRLLGPLRGGPVTSRYPDAAPELPRAARGLPMLDPARCNGTAACVTACPTGAISLTADTWNLDAGACIMCGACERACPQDAIQMSALIELAVRDPADLITTRQWKADSDG
jgi:NADH-quinone oxidoreductase subunit I